ncbi:sel1 repeat family protein [Pelomyxa schiedti]|nr:sel1 repeat family protein [Pelomyxa schiedti]
MADLETVTLEALGLAAEGKYDAACTVCRSMLLTPTKPEGVLHVAAFLILRFVYQIDPDAVIGRGKSTAVDPKEAYYKKAASASVESRRFFAGVLSRVWKRHKLAGDRHHTELSALCTYMLGCMYFWPIGVAKDVKKAVMLYRTGADDGYSWSQFGLGWCLEHGLGTTANAAEAFELYNMAARKGNSVAQDNLGWCYEHGIGCQADVEQATRWYKTAADYGSQSAHAHLADLLITHNPRSLEVVASLRKSAMMGWPYAQLRLYACYKDGYTTKDSREALRWCRLAAFQGSALAMDIIRKATASS